MCPVLEDAVIYTVSTSTELTGARVWGREPVFVYTRTEQRGGVAAPAAKHTHTHTHYMHTRDACYTTGHVGGCGTG